MTKREKKKFEEKVVRFTTEFSIIYGCPGMFDSTIPYLSSYFGLKVIFNRSHVTRLKELIDRDLRAQIVLANYFKDKKKWKTIKNTNIL